MAAATRSQQEPTGAADDDQKSSHESGASHFLESEASRSRLGAVLGLSVGAVLKPPEIS